MEDLIGKVLHLFLMLLPILMFIFKRQIREFFARRDDTNPEIPVGRINEKPIRSIRNHFLMTLDHVKSTAKDGVYLQQIKSELEKMSCLIAWNVNIDKFYEEFERDIKSSLYNKDTKFLSNCSQFVQVKQLEINEYTDEMYFQIPEECQKVANGEQQVKRVYPVVLILYREDTLDITLNDIVCSAWIIHLKDTQMKTKILFNYTKCLNNRIITMNQIYNSDEENLCVACQTERSNINLLPCSHNCVCAECFKRIGRTCPICRAIIQSHFEMKD